MEITTRYLSREEYRKIVRQIIEYLEQRQGAHLNVMYGWNCRCPDVELWIDHDVTTDQLAEFIQNAELAGYYKLGDCDLFIKDAVNGVEFLLCHESDVHFISDVEDSIEDVRSMWAALGIQRN